MNDAALRPPGRGRGTLLLIVGLLVLPFAIGGGLYVGGWQPAHGTQHGRLLNPPPPLPDVLLQATVETRGKWLLLLQVRGPCAADCAARLDELRRIQVSLNKEMGRLRRIVVTDQADDPQLAAVRRAQPDLLLVIAPPGGLAGESASESARTADPVSIADPQGRLVMTYPRDAAAQGIRADLNRLLKFAGNG